MTLPTQQTMMREGEDMEAATELPNERAETTLENAEETAVDVDVAGAATDEEVPVTEMMPEEEVT